MTAHSTNIRTVIIGGSQAGLAVSYHLSRLGQEHIVLESHSRIGESWRRRWDSLRLFTPSKFNALPGMPFPGPDFYFPTKDEVADYLEAYAGTFHLPIRLGVHADSVTRVNGRFMVAAGAERHHAENVVVATGAFGDPVVPAFARDLDPRIVQLHSSAYANPTSVPEGNVLVAGAGNSGAEIAIELAKAGRRVWLAGRDVGRIPADTLGRILGGRPYWWVFSKGLSVDTPPGRKFRRKVLRGGAPWIRLKPADVRNAGVTRCGRVIGVLDGNPSLQDGTTLDVACVVWATGFRPDYRWIRLPVCDLAGNPRQERGIVRDISGLYFIGLHFQAAITSALLGGVGRDAGFIAAHIARRSGETAAAV